MKPWRIACAAAAIFTFHLAWNVLTGVGIWDEAFALRVVDRVRGGEVLYRDVFFGATPLGVHLGRVVAFVFGVEVGAIKIASAACCTASALLACRLARQLIGTHAAAPVLVGSFFVLAPCYPTGLYTPLADALLLAAATFALDRRFLVAGLFAGLCFAAKQNTGSYALAAVLGSQWLQLGGVASLRRVGVVVAAFAAPVLVVLIPVVAQGAWPALLDFGFTGKQHYLAHGGVPYTRGVIAWWNELVAPPAARNLASLFRGQAFLLPILSLGLALVAARRLARPSLAFLPFVAAACVTVYPRADLRHLASAVPALGVLAVAGWHALPDSRTRRALPWCAAAWLGVGLVAVWLPLLRPVARGDRVWSDQPHLGGALLSRSRAAELRDLAVPLRELAGQQIFFATPRASLLYLLSGARNPTPFDWPGVTSMGADGEARTIEAIRSGTIAAVCLETARWELAPLELEHAIVQEMSVLADLGACVLYRSR
jgi:hypothetical protein